MNARATSTQAASQPLGRAHPLQNAAAVVVGLVAAWLLLPLASIQHVEGFSASIESLAMHLANQGSLQGYDRLFPFNLEFFATSRAGTVLALAGLDALLPGVLWTFDALVIFGLLLLLASSVRLVRVWTGAHWLAALFALILLPGVFESAFFYNDNVLASGLAAAALAVLFRRNGAARDHWARAAFAGVLFGAAVITRADAILLAFAALLGLWLQSGWQRVLLLRAAAFGVAAVVVIAALPALLGFTFLDTMAAARRAVSLWARPPNLHVHAGVVGYFVGVPALLAGVVGLQRLLAARAWRLLAFLAIPIVVFNVIYFGKAWDVRSMLPLTPFFAGFVAVGCQWLATGAPRALRWAALVMLLALWLIPSRTLDHLRDGPRELIGRMWSPLLWLAWQESIGQDFDRLHGARFDNDTVLVTHDWNADRYLHLELQRRGFEPDMRQSGQSTCDGTVETFGRGGVVVRHLRLQTAFVPQWRSYMPDRLSRFEASCGNAAAVLPMSEVVSVWDPQHVHAGRTLPLPVAALLPAWGQDAIHVQSLDMVGLRALALSGRPKAADTEVRGPALGSSLKLR